jgi:hypothetical protein
MWASDLADMLGASVLAFMVGGALLSAAYNEVSLLAITLMETTKQILLSSQKKIVNCA